MSSTVLAIIFFFLALVFMIMWFRTRRLSKQTELVAYGLRAQDDHDEITRTNLTLLNSEHQAAIQKLAELGEVKRDNWGRWVWTESGQLVGK